ncbi:MAG: TlpA disulfide reductase family protein [Candidatus Omnitrophota bacterium]
MKKIIVLFVLSCFISSVFPAPKPFSSLSNKDLSYEELVAAPKTVLFIWTTWCPSCRSEFLRMAKECVQYEGVEMLFINSGEREALVQRFIESIKLQECVKEKTILDPELVLAKKFSVFSIPAFIIIKDGKFIHKSSFLSQEIIDAAFK